MLYPTHYRMGIQAGLLFSVLVIIEYYSWWHINSFMLLLLAILLGISGALYGSGWNDIDSKKSIPAREHPIMRKVFELFNITHRGPISHSLLSISIIWLLPAIALKLMVNANLIKIKCSIGNELIIKIVLALFSVNAIRMFLSFFISLFKSDYKSLSGLKNTILFLMTDDFEFAKKSHFRRMNFEDRQKLKYLSMIIAIAIAVVFPVVNINDCLNLMSIYILGVYAGSVVGHWLMDLSTKQGVYIDWKHQIKIGQWMMDNPVLRYFVPESEFKTGSSYEIKVRIIVSFVNIILFILLFYHLFLVLIK